ncbi:MAG: sugar phosphate isomerase/epimerase family protein [Caldimonas sp.]
MKLSLCNEVLAHLPFESQCQSAASFDYAGLELAPYTLHDNPAELTERDARRCRGIAKEHGLAISSLHWLLAQPPGLSIASPDERVHGRTVDFLLRMIDFAAVCGADVLVHGSPSQRSPVAGQSVADAGRRCEVAWERLGRHAGEAGVLYCIEPLRPQVTPVVNTVAEALAVVDRTRTGALRTMVDLSAAEASEAESPAALLRRYLPGGKIAHIQLNDANRRGPGQGSTAVEPVLEALIDDGYDGWIAIEPFEYFPDPISCASFCATYVRNICSEISRRKSAHTAAERHRK